MTASLFLMILTGVVFIIYKERLYGLLWRTKKSEDYKNKKLNEKFKKEIK